MPFMPRRSQQGSARTVSALSGSTPVRSRRTTVASKGQGTASSSGSKAKPTTLTKFIKNVAGGLAETKRVIFYGGGDNFNVDQGALANANYTIQNNFINNNATDIHRLIPLVTQGTADNQRIGESIRPKALILRGRVGVNTNPIVGDVPNLLGYTDIVVVMYILQHKNLKSYTALSSLNDFSELLETGQGSTKTFLGNAWDGQLPVANQNYTLVKKKKFRLRWGSATVQTAPNATGLVAGPNSHDYYQEFSINLKKHLPAKLLFPDNNQVSSPNDPTNSSLFFALGFYPYQGYNPGAQPTSWLKLQYTTELLYKDM